MRYWDGRGWTDILADSTTVLRPDRASLSQPGPSVGSMSGRRPLTRSFFLVTQALQGFLILYMGVQLLGLAGSLMLARFLGDIHAGSDVDPSQADTIDRFNLVASIAAVLVYLCCIVLWLVWLHRGYVSDRVDPRLLRHSSGWAVGSWFVPVLNLARPFGVHSDLWRAALARDPRAASGDPRPGWLLPTWWGVWLANGFLGNLSFRMSGRAFADDGTAGYDEMITALRVEWVSIAVAIASAVLALLVVRGTTRALTSQPTATVPQPHAPASTATPSATTPGKVSSTG